MTLLGRRFAALAALLLLSGAAGCRRYTFSGDPTGRLMEPVHPVPYAVDWWVHLVRSPLLEFMPAEVAAPAYDAKRHQVVVLTRDGHATAVREGQVRWSVDLGGRFSAGATIVDDVVYVPGGDGILRALDAESGAERWRYDTGAELVTTPTVAGDSVFVQTETDVVVAIDRGTGHWRWQYRRDVPSGFSIRGAATPVVEGDTVYAGFSDGHLVALSTGEGLVRWDRPLSSGGTQFLDVDATPVLDGQGGLYVASYRDGVMALDAASGDIRWIHAVGGMTQLVAHRGIVWAAGDAQLLAIETEKGKLAWKLPLKDQAARRPALARRYLIVPTGSQLLFVDAARGQKVMTWDPGRGITAPPVWADGRLFVLSNLGVLYAMQLRPPPRSW